MQAEPKMADSELLALAELTDEVAQSVDDTVISRRLLTIAEHVRQLAIAGEGADQTS